MSSPVRVLFVCMGNICRSPTAHGVFEELAAREGLADRVQVSSAGTVGHHEGDPPDERTQEHALKRGFDLSHLRARKVTPAMIAEADLVLAMDRNNLAVLEGLAPAAERHKLKLFLDFAPAQPTREVPDPYYGGPAGFEEVLDLVEAASRGLLAHVREIDRAA
jgi:protein-tyrosine phosphatase